MVGKRKVWMGVRVVSMSNETKTWVDFNHFNQEDMIFKLFLSLSKRSNDLNG